MGDKKNTLLIGNGLNRCLPLENELSWDNLLRGVANDYGVESGLDLDIPLPLEFERIINLALQNGIDGGEKIYEFTKKKIAEKIKALKISNDAVHNELKTLNLDCIITTNYDFLLENVFDANFKVF